LGFSEIRNLNFQAEKREEIRQKSGNYRNPFYSPKTFVFRKNRKKFFWWETYWEKLSMLEIRFFSEKMKKIQGLRKNSKKNIEKKKPRNFFLPR